MIEAMRQGDYPGSALTIDSELARGGNYARYYAYYLSEGFKIYGLLTIPDGEPPAGGWPGIVFLHGHIPPEQYRTGERYRAYVDRIARAGYVVLMPDLRGHDRSEGEAISGNRDGAYTVDALNAVASLQAHPQVDAARIGMWGHSMGGGITLRAMVLSDQIKAGVIWAGVVAPYPAPILRWPRPVTGAVDDPSFWAAVSPNSYVADLSGPLQLHHGTRDDSVPIEWSEGLVADLEAAGQPYEYIVYEGEDHNLAGSIALAMDRSVAFFDAWVQ
jgi:dipeptidyl aminopeptidase/acylaminoacyl peptidase